MVEGLNLDEVEAQLRQTIRELRENPARIAQYVTAVERERRQRMTVERFDGVIHGGPGDGDNISAVHPNTLERMMYLVDVNRQGKDVVVTFANTPPPQYGKALSNWQLHSSLMHEPTKQQQAREYLRFALGSALQAGVSAGRAVAHLYRAARVLVERG